MTTEVQRFQDNNSITAYELTYSHEVLRATTIVMGVSMIIFTLLRLNTFPPPHINDLFNLSGFVISTLTTICAICPDSKYRWFINFENPKCFTLIKPLHGTLSIEAFPTSLVLGSIGGIITGSLYLNHQHPTLDLASVAVVCGLFISVISLIASAQICYSYEKARELTNVV